MIPQFNAIILDIVVVLVLLTITAFGVLKGIKHASSNFLLLGGAFVISFSSITNFLKVAIIDILSEYVKLGAGVSDNVKLGIYLSYMFFASLLLMLLVYGILRLLKYFIALAIRKRAIKNNKLPSRPSTVSRVFGGIVNFLFAGVVMILGLSVLKNPIFGLDKTMENGYIAKYVAQADDLVLDNLVKDELFEEKVILKLVKGDLFYNVDDEGAKALQGASKLFEEGNLIPNDLNNVQAVLNSIYDVLFLVDTYALDDAGMEIDGFEQAVALVRDMANKSINKINELNTSEHPLDADKTLAISKLLTKLGLKESAIIFENIFVIR